MSHPAPESLSWPLLPRAASEELILGLRSSRSQLLRGASGIGKTTLASQVAATLAAGGRRTVSIIALAELQAVPLAALAPSLSAFDIRGDNLDLSEAIDNRVHTLIRVLGAAPDEYLLVVDDAPLLDEVSAAVVYQLVRVFAVPALLTARDEHPLTGPIARLIHEDLVTVTELAALSVGESESLVRLHLRDEVRPESIDRLHATSEGNPLFLRELLFSAQRAGRVRPGPFGVEVEPGSLPSHLLDTVRDRIDDLNDASRHLAELLSLSQPWPQSLVRVAHAEALETLLRRGLAVVDEAVSRQPVRLAHPLFTEALSSALSNVERQSRLSEAAAALQSTGELSDRFTAVCLRVDSVGGPADDLTWAAEQAIVAGDAEMARRLAEAALRNGPHFRPSLLLAVALSTLGSADDADDAFDDAEALAADEAQRVLVALRRGQHLAYRRRDPAGAVAQTAESCRGVSAAVRRRLDPEMAKWRLMAGESAEWDDAEPVPADPLATVSAGVMRAMFATMAGDAAAAMAAVEEVRALTELTQTDLPHADSLLDLSTFLALVADARIDEAESLVERRRLLGSAEAAGMWSYTLALIRLHAGRHDLALPVAELAVRQLKWRDFTGLLASATALAVAVSCRAGDRDTAARYREMLDESDRRDIKVALHLAEAAVWAAESGSGRQVALDDLAETIRSAFAQEHHLLASLSATVAIRIGRSDAVAPLLAEASERSPSLLIAAVTGALAALAAGDADTALSAIPRLRAAGLVAVAWHVATQSADLPRTTELTRRRAIVSASEMSTHILAEPVAGPKKHSLAGISLTESEWRVATAAAHRERSREIAERLGVSVRTVDNHLASVYRKLGISGRAELSALVDG